MLHGVDAAYQPTFENAFEYCLPEYRDALKSSLLQAIDQGNEWQCKFDVQLSDGSRKRVKAEGRPIVEGGHVTAFMGCFEELDAQVNFPLCSPATPVAIEARMRELFELRAIIDEAAIFSVSDKHGKILSANQNLIEISGYSEDELLGHSHNIMNSGFHGPEFFARMWEKIASGEVWRGEICNKNKSGDLLWFDTIIYPVLDQNGQPDRFLSLRLDITEKVQSSHLVSEFFDVSNSPSFVLDGRGYLRRVNEAFCGSLGYSSSDLMHTPLLNLIKPEERHAATDAFRKIVVGRPGASLEFTCLHASGAERVLTFRANRFEGQIFGSAVDVTEEFERKKSLQQAKQAAIEANQSKSAFLANMSHEIRTPLNAIIGVADVLSRDQHLENHQRELVDMIYDAGSMLEGLLTDILDLSKIEAGKLKLEETTFLPMEEVRSALRLHMLRAQEHGVFFACTEDMAEGVQLVGDPLRLRQIISNLASNAVKFTEKGSIQVHAAVKMNEALPILELYIQDTGIGFPVETAGEVFERFEQSRSSDTRVFGGTGLGLAISSSLARDMGGSLRVRSKPGAGTRFDLSIPFVVAPSKTTLKEAVKSDATVPDLSTKKILVAEDSMVNQKVLRLVLRPTQCDIVFVENGEEAVRAFQEAERAFDLVLMDMRMPKMNGHDAVKLIRSFEVRNALVPTPIIMVSANAMGHNVQEAMQAGCNTHIAKPIRQKTLFAEIARFLPDPG
ncbi:hybrid sensor histidine kinase/response regulator [Shimia marina]|uniref:histidine kinase n=1 Tax=Shimia marina TaxID=321267 RepID=A0A0P1F866_9RHOB|nr:hybrid sensor histidine kinase/response regulator [Shimia marina]CUH50875.1 Autoinducer 2 sensor kinase/phosphatase LuxQ [Shimia marina]SFE55575.1 PAS domain S-box-containing protein [Shimia marina]